MITNDKETKTIKSDVTVLDIIEYLREVDSARITEISAEVGISKSSVHAHLATLEQRGYAAKEGDQYKLGMCFLNLGASARNKVPHFDSIRERVERLANQTDERTQFVIEEHGQAYVIFRSFGQYAVRARPRIGQPTHLHTSASGKAILSGLPRERVREIIDYWGLPQKTENTITDRETLFEELDEVRDQGYAVNTGESQGRFLSAGAPIRTDESILGAITISGPEKRMHDRLDDEIIDLLLGVTNELELNLTN
ncbi:IclR family transcriptional regulator [Natrialba sp. INN-245]|uniref:IclR family transcriptional regulator n=1 Tax=Natrialba sp. INN-245 TaxID=2690967 RepID=UPI001311FF63|nr:IclR family transcriptional regulator [Natrialba sp. INN-245]MWV38493.1 helix-turn-helix domain-containing protein [Natrialba sp. INN-245]